MYKNSVQFPHSRSLALLIFLSVFRFYGKELAGANLIQSWAWFIFKHENIFTS